MAFGFGFNKAKVLASAEKNVKAGKLQNAIADYEKIIAEDAKDLTVLNTIGDLYARLGKTEQATSYYKRVGDAFATNGFTVKAIAVYKKITKLDSSAIDCVSRLAELYAQQGLHNDARSQFALVAEHHLKAGALDKAAHIFQKVLDLDPDNAAMQAKLAELYGRLGKKNEARDIYLRNAELYRSRKNFAAADESLAQALNIDKTFSQAILLRGMVKMELGDAEGTIQCLEQVPDLDSRPEGLRTLLNAYFKLGKLEAAGPLARKLYTVFHESQGLATYGEALVSGNHTEEALALYSEFADVLLSAKTDTVINALQGCIARVKDNPAALEQLSGLLERAGQTTHLAEIKELLAHASVQSGDLAKARELYRELARIEPDNPLHTQNYRQVLAKLGEDPSARPLSAEEAAQPVLVDELEGTLPEIPQEYTPEVTEAVRAALTEAELFDSYNLPAKAVAPLEAVLSRAPHHPQLNQRLASLYARTNRFADAAVRCRALEQVYKQAGYGEQAHEYGELAAKYAARGGTPAATPAAAPTSAPAIAFEPAVAKAPAPPAAAPAFAAADTKPEAHTGTVAEFEFTPAAPEPPEPHHAPAAFELTFDSPVAPEPKEHSVQHETEPAAHPKATEPAPSPEASPVAAPATPVAEFDLSSEWDDMVEVEAEPTTSTPEIAASAHEITVAAPAITEEEPVAHEPLREETPVAHIAPPAFDAPAPQLEAVPEHHASAEPLAHEAAHHEQGPTPTHELTLDHPGEDSHAAIFEMLGATPESGYPEHISDLIEEIRFYASQQMSAEVHSAMAKLEREAPEAAADLRRELAIPQAPVAAPPPPTAEPFAAIHEADPFAQAHQTYEQPPFAVADTAHQQHQPSFAEVPQTQEHHQPAFTAGQAGFEQHENDILSDLDFEHVAAAEPLADKASEDALLLDEPELEPVAVLQPLDIAASSQHAVADSVESLLDLDSALGEDFEIAPAMAAAAAPSHASMPAAASVPAPVAHAAAAAAATSFVAPPPPPSFTPTPSAPTSFQTPAPPPLPPTPSTTPASAPTDTALDFGDGALADIFAEFKHDMESTTATAEDPETHYNLGVAFKEMGLLDEAIGELQKVCQAIDRGEDFPQALQAYTWLADCFLQKGVPEAAMRWYEKALRSPHVQAETAMAIHYELACACEQAGNRSGALTHFMEVYGANIDYRDVAERIKSLKS